jgi:hypothetical protein
MFIRMATNDGKFGIFKTLPQGFGGRFRWDAS